MKILKTILKFLLFFFLGVLALALIGAAFLPKQTTYSAEINIDRPHTEVYEYISQLRHQEQYGYWNLADPSMAQTYQGTDGTVGFRTEWTSEQMGNGSQVITKLVPNESMESALDFGFGGKPAESTIRVKPITAHQSKVYFGVTMYAHYPANLIFLIPMDAHFEKSLDNLKRLLEAKTPLGQN